MKEDFTQAPKAGSRPGSIKRKTAAYLGKGAGDKLTKSDAEKLIAIARRLKSKGGADKKRGIQLQRQANFIKNMVTDNVQRASLRASRKGGVS
jgi:hypothetical protein